MAFTQTKGRYATFGVVTSLPGEVIDSFWYFIDQYLKHVIPLKHILHFKLQNKKGKLSIIFSQEKYPNTITVDFPYKFDRSNNWDGIGQVELDAINPRKLKSMLQNEIDYLFDEDAYESLIAEEEREQELFREHMKEYVKNM